MLFAIRKMFLLIKKLLLLIHKMVGNNENMLIHNKQIHKLLCFSSYYILLDHLYPKT